jgi:hypothetical protein
MFSMQAAPFCGHEESSVPETAQLWLNRFSLPHKDFVPACASRILRKPETLFRS